MKSVEKLLGVFVFIVCIMLLPNVVNAENDIFSIFPTYEKDGKDAQVLKIESEILKKTEYLTEYTNAKNVELETLQRSLQTSDEFYKKLYNTLSRIAESGGYSMILSLQESNAILWYSSSVDITSQVISELGL